MIASCIQPYQNVCKMPMFHFRKPRPSLVPAVHLADPFPFINFVSIGFWMPSDRFRMPRHSFMMVVHLTRIFVYWRSNSCLVVIGNMLLTRHTREALLPGSNVGSTEARRDAGVLQLAVEVVLQLRLAVHWQLMSQVLLLSLRLLLEVLHGVQLSCVGVHVLFLGVHVGLGHLLPHGVVLAVQVADAVHGPRLAAPRVGTPLRVDAHVLHCAAP